MQRIKSVDGLKAFCALWVVVLHYALALDIPGYVGWQSGIAASDALQHYAENLPFSLLANGNFALYIFFAVIAFIPAQHFFQMQDRAWIQRQAIVRYFRFVPYTLILSVVSYVISAQGWYYNNELGQLLQEPWNLALLKGDMSLEGAVISGLISAMVLGEGNYITSLWCMHIIFIGSYLAYMLLFFFCQLRRRYYIYLFLWLFFLYAPLYSFFLIGIVAADILYTQSFKIPTRYELPIFILGVVCCFLGDVPWPYAWLKYVFQSIGIFIVLWGVCSVKPVQKICNHPLLLHCSRYSFEYILVHALILFSISSWIFIQLYAIAGYSVAVLFTVLTAIPLNALGAVAFGKVLQPLCSFLSRKAYGFFSEEK